MDINLPPFYVGQKVVYLDLSIGFCVEGSKIKRGQIVVVKGLDFSKLHVGSKSKTKAWFIEISEHPGCLYIASDFAPVQENFQSISLEKILEEETKLIGVN